MIDAKALVIFEETIAAYNERWSMSVALPVLKVMEYHGNGPDRSLTVETTEPTEWGCQPQCVKGSVDDGRMARVAAAVWLETVAPRPEITYTEHN